MAGGSRPRRFRNRIQHSTRCRWHSRVGGSRLQLHRVAIADLAGKNRLPAIYEFSQFVESGGLMCYGASLDDLYRRAAVYVDKILKGTKPADLPVQQPTKFELVINLKAAKQIGLTIPQSVLYRADKVINAALRLRYR
ncbi:MAG: hypothetical protein E6J89_12340 [Deltaproteobacteria bacterium]|nr:MAG: hypothetical protein E6J89_12340 [Deltaproteobacteria bacterium]